MLLNRLLTKSTQKTKLIKQYPINFYQTMQRSYIDRFFKKQCIFEKSDLNPYHIPHNRLKT